MPEAKRMIAQISSSCGQGPGGQVMYVYALCTDGTLWERLVFPETGYARKWQKLPGPPGCVNGESDV